MEGLASYAGGAQADSRRAVDTLVLQDDQVSCLLYYARP